ncbi:MAG TPA: cyclopropane-fatty-acyl-phospholipid synthase family protein [Gemmatimonadaceae bacterium]|nr:cyclopropane-fatty-acyl-phospholipid synthase family protein [Gemmatimonadaceae bacterium]
MSQPNPIELTPDRDAQRQGGAEDRDSPIARTLAVLDLAFGPARNRNYDIRLWEATVQRGGVTPAADFSITFTRRGALRRMLLPPSELSIVEAVISGDVEIAGNLESAMGLADVVSKNVQSVGGTAKLVARVLALPRDDEAPPLDEARYSRGLRLLTPRARKGTAPEIRFHYDLGNEFYSLWLDPRMQYSCAYYRKATDDLATAQLNKLDHICRKLRMKPGERFLDIGCGWGGLVMHAAEKYGVRATGITLSLAQAEWAHRKIAEKGLTDRCKVEVLDFRDLPDDARFEKMSSVGVTEHIAESEQPAHFALAFRALEPGGLFMNQCEVSTRSARRTHSTGERFSRWLWKRDQFIDKYVFPDAKLVPLAAIIRSAERAGFETRDIESLREHYAMTLRAWVKGLEQRRAEAAKLVGERTYRVWKLYMSAAAYSFNTAGINLAQTLLAKPGPDGTSGMPLTREYMYEPH